MAAPRLRGSLEIRLLTDGARGRTRVVRLPPAAQRAFAALALAFALLFAAGLAAAPSTLSSLFLARAYGVQASRRLQLGERLQALVDRLEQTRQRGALLAERLARIQGIYEIAEAGAGGVPPAPSPTGPPPDSIFASTIAHGNRLETALARDLELARRRLEAIAAFERSQPELVATIPARPPLAGSSWVRTSAFGPRRSLFTHELEPHAGLDLAAPVGTPILAPAAGRVSFAGPVEADRRSDWWRMGRMVVVRHGDRFLTLYGHCERLLVRAGQRGAAGDPLATVGETGWATAPHLHYEIRRRRPSGNWEAVDPLDYAWGLSGGEPPAARSRPPADAGSGEAPALLPAFLR